MYLLSDGSVPRHRLAYPGPPDRQIQQPAGRPRCSGRGPAPRWRVLRSCTPRPVLPPRRYANDSWGDRQRQQRGLPSWSPRVERDGQPRTTGTRGRPTR